MKNLGKNAHRDYLFLGIIFPKFSYEIFVFDLFIENFLKFFIIFLTNTILAALISSIPLASAFGFSNGKHLLTELKKYGFEAERVADYGCYCQFLTDGGVNPPGMVHFLLVHE